MGRNPNRPNQEKNLTYLVVKEVYSEVSSKLFLKRQISSFLSFVFSCLTLFCYFAFFFSLIILLSSSNALLSLLFFYLFSHPIKIFYFLSFCLYIILREHKSFKTWSTQHAFFSTLVHKPVSSPWAPMENVDIQRTGPCDKTWKPWLLYSKVSWFCVGFRGCCSVRFALGVRGAAVLLSIELWGAWPRACSTERWYRCQEAPGPFVKCCALWEHSLWSGAISPANVDWKGAPIQPSLSRGLCMYLNTCDSLYTQWVIFPSHFPLVLPTYILFQQFLWCVMD